MRIQRPLAARRSAPGSPHGAASRRHQERRHLAGECRSRNTPAGCWRSRCGGEGYGGAKLRLSCGGIALIDCLAYIALLAIILTMAFMAFYRTMEHSRDLSRNAADITRTLQAGERWRADLRASTRPPRLETLGDESFLHVVNDAGEVNYVFRDGAVLRQALPNTNWVELLPRAASSRIFEERRQHVGVWRWEVELKGAQKAARVRPLFSFQAVASKGQKQ